MRSRQRTHFTDYQTRILEERFTHCHYPNSDVKKELAAELGLLENRITVWFQNRRAKKRRHVKKENESSVGFRNGLMIPSTLSRMLAPLNLPLVSNKIEPNLSLTGGDIESSSSGNFSWYSNNEESSTMNDWKFSEIKNNEQHSDPNYFDAKYKRNNSKEYYSNLNNKKSDRIFNNNLYCNGSEESISRQPTNGVQTSWSPTTFYNISSNVSDPIPANSPNFTPYSVAQQSYIHPNFVNVPVMSNAFNNSESIVAQTQNSYFFYPQV